MIGTDRLDRKNILGSSAKGGLKSIQHEHNLFCFNLAVAGFFAITFHEAAHG
jgi:hypothetical protein